MANYTRLTSIEIKDLMDSFGISEISNFELMEGGSENSSFIVENCDNKFVLSVYNEKSFDQVRCLAKLLYYLTENDFPTTKIMESTSGELVINYKQKPTILKKYLNGEVCKNLNLKMLFQLGITIGELHKIPPSEYLPRNFPYGVESFSQVISRFPNREYSKWLKEKHGFICRGLVPQLPTGLVHGDIFWDNVLFERNNLTGIIDFEEACNYYKIFDLGMCIVGTCIENGEISFDKIKSLLIGYESIRKLEDTEREALPLFSEYGAVATSFWRFRHHFITNPQSKNDNYLEMVAIANDIHQKNPSFRNLYL